jgi:6-phosphogluconolactonase
MIDSFETPDDLAGLAADLTTRALSDAVIERGAAVLVGTGGRSPGPVYDRLATSSLDWSKISVTLSDDRFVPADSPESNERLVRERLLSGNAAAAKFVPMSVAAESVEAAAGAVEGAVRALAPFDVMLLGMGEDGHIASLIPGSPVLEAGMDPAGERYCLGVPAGVGSPPLARVTMTMPALLQARLTLILISGEAKRRIVGEGNGLPVHALLEQAKAPVRVLWSP